MLAGAQIKARSPSYDRPILTVYPVARISLSHCCDRAYTYSTTGSRQKFIVFLSQLAFKAVIRLYM